MANRTGYKGIVKQHGEFVLDYSEIARNRSEPQWFIGRGRVAGNTSPIPSGLHATPRQAWRAAAFKLGLAGTSPATAK